jgi:uncharacterized membrane protein
VGEVGARCAHHAHPARVTQLLVAAAIALATNIVTFGLLYWQVDGGGPTERLARSGRYPDFQFPQTGTEGLAPPNSQPRFQDHLYVAFTNVVAFSPTDTLPLTHRVKGLMAIQSMISLAVLVVVISRVINILCRLVVLGDDPRLSAQATASRPLSRGRTRCPRCPASRGTTR